MDYNIIKSLKGVVEIKNKKKRNMLQKPICHFNVPIYKNESDFKVTGKQRSKTLRRPTNKKNIPLDKRISQIPVVEGGIKPGIDFTVLLIEEDGFSFEYHGLLYDGPIAEKKISDPSVGSPLGLALLMKRVGDTFKYELPDGKVMKGIVLEVNSKKNMVDKVKELKRNGQKNNYC